MSHDHKHQGGGDGEHQHHQHSFIDMEDILSRYFELLKDRMQDFLIKAGLTEGQQVLELGCGFAPLLEFYCDTVGPSGGVTLVDPEAKLADRLAPRLAARPNTRFVACSAENVALPELDIRPPGGGFNMVVMANVYHHLDNPAAALAAIRSVLQPAGGRLVILDFIHDTLRIFASDAASPTALATQARLADLLRPAASPVTARCSAQLTASGFELRLREAFVLHDKLSSKLGDFYVEVFLKHSLQRLASRGTIGETAVAELLAELPNMLEGDPDAALFTDIHVMLAAEMPRLSID